MKVLFFNRFLRHESQTQNQPSRSISKYKLIKCKTNQNCKTQLKLRFLEDNFQKINFSIKEVCIVSTQI
jgi:hypothetical protein